MGGAYWKDLFEIARRMKRTAPELSARMQWIETDGKSGHKPDLKSVLIRDYGPVLCHDFGLSAAIKGRRITGHVSGRSGGRIQITPPAAFNPKRVKATLAGRPLQVMVKDSTIHFAVELKQADGTREFAIDL